MSKKKMGNMTSLSKLSGIKSKPDHTTKTTTPEPLVNKSEVREDKQEKTEAKVSKKTSDPAAETAAKERASKKTQKKKQSKLVTVNIKIREDQKRWLADTASTVRDNNTEPVPPAERVYPQHLIGVAIDLLQNADVDWEEVRNVEELREQLKI